jgi:ribonuclease VapC
MIVVDTSALMAILRDESDRELYVRCLSQADSFVASSLTVYEARTVVLRQMGPAFIADLQALLDGASITHRPFDQLQSELACATYARYGKGTGHPARLNLADCAAYALATSLDAALLYKGDDFALTDVRRALDP